MSVDVPVVPGEVPEFTGDLSELEAKTTAVRGHGAKVVSAAGAVHSTFGGLRAFYQAPEAEQLFATSKPVTDKAATIRSDMGVIAGALSTYADEVRPLARQLEELRAGAQAFRDKIASDDEWREDGDLVDENNARRDKIAEVLARFQAAERACQARIAGLVGGKLLQVDDGSGQPGMYGYDAETLKQAQGLPWGDPVEESIPWWHFGDHGREFAKGVFIDGAWGTVKGLGTLVGVEGSEAAGEAWLGLAKLGTGSFLTLVTAGGFLTVSDDHLPSWLRDSKTAMKETGKAFVAWDQWESNPARAAGGATFNVLTTVLTGGVGGSASAAGKAGAAAKAISVAGKVGRAIDPMTYAVGGVGGLMKAGDALAGMRALGKLEAPRLTPETINLPEGAYKLPDGTLKLPEGAAVPDGAITIPERTVRLPKGTEIPPGAINLGDGMVQLPKGTAPPAGAVEIPAGTAKAPEGTPAFPPGTLKLTDHQGNTVYLTKDGAILNADGTLRQPGNKATQEPSPQSPGADTPRAHTPNTNPPATTKLPERDLAAVGGGGGDTIRLGSDTSDPLHHADGTPTPRPDATPGGTTPDNMPRNGADTTPPPSTGGPHTDAPSRGGHADSSGGGGGHSGGQSGSGHPDGPSADNGGRHEAPSRGDGAGGGRDDPGNSEPGGSGAARGPNESPVGSEVAEGMTDEFSRGDHVSAAPTGPMLPDQEAAVTAALDRAKMQAQDQQRLLVQLRKGDYGRGVAEHIARGSFDGAPGYGDLLKQCKQKGMLPAVHQALEFASELQARGVENLAFEYKSKGLDLDVLVKSGDEIIYGCQLKDIQREQGITSAAQKIAGKQLAGTISGPKVAILDVNDTIAALTESTVKDVKHYAEKAGATYQLRFRDGSVTIPGDGRVYP